MLVVSPAGTRPGPGSPRGAHHHPSRPRIMWSHVLYTVYSLRYTRQVSPVLVQVWDVHMCGQHHIHRRIASCCTTCTQTLQMLYKIIISDEKKKIYIYSTEKLENGVIIILTLVNKNTSYYYSDI